MKIFVAGASGAIGKPLIGKLIQQGHLVTGMTQSDEGAKRIRSQGAKAVIASAFDAAAVSGALRSSESETVIDQLTSLPKNPAEFASAQAKDRKLRIEGGGNLLQAAQACGVRRYIQQASGFFLKASSGLADENAPLATDASPSVASSAQSYAQLEKRVLSSAIEPVVLRYGFFYGPGTWYEPKGGYADMARQQKLPIIGGGAAVWSWIHIDDAADATVAALTIPPGVYNIVDDDPLPVRVWLPAFAESVGAPEPPEMTEAAARETAGEDAVFYATRLVGATNAKAKRTFGFAPRHLEWLSA